MEREIHDRPETPEMDESPRLLSSKEAALALGCSPDTIKRLLAGGKLQGRRLGGTRGHWRITRASVDAFAEGKR